jgi:hypothetical protein
MTKTSRDARKGRYNRSQMIRPTVARVDLSALRSNYRDGRHELELADHRNAGRGGTLT